MKFDLVWQRMKDYADIRLALDSGRPGLSLSVNCGPFGNSWSALEQVSWVYNEGGEQPYLWSTAGSNASISSLPVPS